MPIEHSIDNDQNAVSITLTDQIDSSDFETLLRISQEISASPEGSWRVRVSLANATSNSVRPGSEAKFFSKVEKVAVIADSEVETLLPIICDIFSNSKLRTFEPTRTDDADQWLMQ